MASIKQAVGIILTRDPESTEVYLVKRNNKLRFFGGYEAFVGGKLDAADRDIPVLNAETCDTGNLPYIVAATREIFEETGILLTSGAGKIAPDRLQDYRRQLLEEEIDFKYLLETEKVSIDANRFHFLCSIITPEFSPVRYDTQFFWVHLPESAIPEILQGELVEGTFVTAEKALDLWVQGEMLIVPPVIFMLKEMVGLSLTSAAGRIKQFAEDYKRGRIHQVYFTPGVQLIAQKTRTLLPATHTNTYLVGEDDLYIIDPAPPDPNEQDRLWNYFEERLKEGKTFKAILLTHHHSDHIGAVKNCQKRYRLPLFAHPKTAEKLPMFHFSGFLNDGDELNLGTAPDGSTGWKLKVLHTPGHASGHLAFQENRYGAIIAGDLISTLSTIVINPPDGHLATYIESLKRMESLATGTIYPGHGPAVLNGRDVLRQYIQHRLQREKKLRESLSDKPQATDELVAKVYDDVEPMIWPLAELSLKAGLIKLIEEGKCKQVKDGFVSL